MRVVDVGDDVEQVLAGRLDVLELGGQEVVALLQRGELLQRQRIDPAQLVELALGLLGATLLGGPVERHRRGRGDLFAAFARLLVLGHLQLRRRQRHVGAVLGDQVGGRHAELLEYVLLELLDPKCRLRFGDFVAVQRVGERGDLGAEFVDLFTRLRQRACPVLAFGGDLVAGAGRDGHRRAQPLRDKAAGLGHRGRDRRGVLARLARALGAQPGLAFGGRRPAQRIRPSANGIRAFLGGAHGQPRLHLGGAGCFGRGHRLPGGRRVRASNVGSCWALCSRCSSSASSSTVWLRPASSSLRCWISRCHSSSAARASWPSLPSCS